MSAQLEPASGESGEADSLVLEQHFAIVPEWVLDADISDAALRLYAVLLRYGQTSGQRMPSRAVLAARLRKRSKDSVDRALKELVRVGAVVVQRRRVGNVYLTNQYTVRSTPPLRRPGRPRTSHIDEQADARVSGKDLRAEGSGRKSAATREARGGSRSSAATPGPTDAATVAADLRPNPECLTQRESPPPSPSAPSVRGGGGGRGAGGSRGAGDDSLGRLLEVLSVETLDDLAAKCRDARRRLGLPAARWTPKVLADVMAAAVFDHGWPGTAAIPALLALAGDPQTRGPARLTCPGPWWDAAELAATPDGEDWDAELAELEACLAEVGGERVRVQRLAREQLAADGLPVSRLNVARRAVALLPDEGPRGQAC